MSEVFDIADRYVDAYAALDPIAATGAGHRRPRRRAHRLLARRRRGTRRSSTATRSRRSTRGADHRRRDRIAADVMRERLAARGRRSTKRARSCATLRVIGSPVQDDPVSASTSWRTTPTTTGRSSRARMARVPGRAREPRSRAARGHAHAASSRRGARRSACAEQADDVGRRDRRRRSSATCRAHAAIPTMHARSRDAADAATERVRASSARSSATSTRPTADPRDPVGARALRAVRRASFNGIELDLDETYAWGWEELYRIEERDARASANASCPARRVAAVIDHLDHDATRAIEGVDEFQQWNQELIDRRSPSSTARTSTSPSRCTGARR